MHPSADQLSTAETDPHIDLTRETNADEFALTKPVPLQHVLDELDVEGRLVFSHRFDAESAQFSELSEPLPDLISGLAERPFWRHQAEAIDRIRRGESVVIATPTASGKSRCYQTAIAESVSTGLRAGTSLLLYPTKALAHDQLRAFSQLGVKRLVAETYDGDASREQRTWARNHANVLLTNPEMMHYGLLPQHRKWATFLKRLDYVVIDELHVLRGVFGSHVGHILRRLRRLCHRYGSDPTFIFTSATIGKPAELASDLCGKPVTAVTNDGSPSGSRTLAAIQPALIDVDKGIRQSPITETIHTVTELLLSGRRVICFCSSRVMTEQIAAGIRRALPPELSDVVRSYRGGYLAEERREIEAEVEQGTVRAIITTSALELGIDIGNLDATVLCGFPGTIASFWQQAGRAGRSGQESLTVFVAGSDQLDQWYVNQPRQLIERRCEPAVVNLKNPFIHDPHIECAAYEMPLLPDDETWWGDLDESIHRGVVNDRLRIRPDQRDNPRAVWDGDGVPFNRFGLRSASGGEVKIVNTDRDLIGTVESSRAPSIVHPGAVYLHRGQPWRVESLDLTNRTAMVEQTDGKHTTQTRSSTMIEPLSVSQSKQVGHADVFVGQAKVTTTVIGYQLKKAGTKKVLEEFDLDLPPQELVTTAVWYEWQHELIERAGISERALPGALHAAEHTAIGILPLFAICDRWDVGGVSIASAPETGLPTVFIYDGYPGGAGIARLAFDASHRHLEATIELLKHCECLAGCPSCVQSPKCGNGNEPLDKAAALALLVNTTTAEAEPF